MLDSLITSKTRVKLLLKFFSNAGTRAYLRGLADEFGESTNAVRVELNRLTTAGLLESSNNGRTKMYQANTGHALFPELQSLVRKYLGLDKVVEILEKLGSVELALISGDYARGIDSGLIDLTLVGRVDARYLQHLVKRTEKIIKRKIRLLVLDRKEFETLQDKLNLENALVIWESDETSPTEPVDAKKSNQANA